MREEAEGKAEVERRKEVFGEAGQGGQVEGEGEARSSKVICNT